MNLFSDPATGQSYANKFGDAVNASTPKVRLFNPETFTPEYYEADERWRDLYDDKGPYYGVFWPDALTQAMRLHSATHGLQGYNYTSLALDEGAEQRGPRLDTTLSVLTGKPAWVNNFNEYNNSAQLYAYLERSIYTPMMFTTLPDAQLKVTDPAMKEKHVYPIISTYYNSTTNAQMIQTRNVWGRTDNFTWVDVWANGDEFIHLEGWDNLQ
jgi:hypothetical protein